MILLRTAILLLFSIALCAAETWPIDKDVVIFEGIVADTKIRIEGSERPFDPKAHKVSELHNKGTEEEPNWIGATIDGSPAIGTDQTVPPKGLPQLDRLTVFFDDKKIDVPSKLLHRVFLPHLTHRPGTFTNEYADTIISVSADAKCVIIDLGVGDGGGTASTVFIVSSDGIVTTEYPRRPEP
ncbi:hypothetical protein QQ054_16135 [Oscillatoria amoena NRMC-F 0135]|nr:hypothetical protein [Oscillatoria laete-virens]MDL5047545.1 hypothetical protein [Oscillatoria amoena NRMC-F 0135]MDL5054632.1 hypothetical protein [Oscillatoria laete-virens NRMC-F 0139]